MTCDQISDASTVAVMHLIGLLVMHASHGLTVVLVYEYRARSAYAHPHSYTYSAHSTFAYLQSY